MSPSGSVLHVNSSIYHVKLSGGLMNDFIHMYFPEVVVGAFFFFLNALESGVSVGSRYILVSEVLVETTLGSKLHPSEPTQKCQAWWSALVILELGPAGKPT